MEHCAFGLEPLEGRALFSVVMPWIVAPAKSTAPVRPALQATAAVTNPLALPFNVVGTFTHSIGRIGNPDASGRYEFTGVGKTKSLGSFTLVGFVQPPGFIANGNASGKFIITTSKGTLTLYLHGPPQDPGILPPILSYRIGAGTGAYANSSGKGLLSVLYSNNTQKFLFRFNQTR